ncbi:MAG TPA: TetR/AcrR family transcriptional regulator [Aggregatilineales bacterium]|nr:TetR/AcrR family transcriptional regulator [Aggregatilineales bacterium]
MPARNQKDIDPLLSAARDVFHEQGYAAATLELVAARSKVSLKSIQHDYPDKSQLLAALLAAYSPLDDVLAALEQAEGDTAEDLIRSAFRAMVETAEKHDDFWELAALDMQATNGSYLTSLGTQVALKSRGLLERIKATGELRPVSDLILARTLVSLLIGFVLSERAVPRVARTALRFFPQRAWVDGAVDLILYGVLEDHA